MPDTTAATRWNLENAWPSRAGETHHYHITLENGTVGSARAITVGGAQSITVGASQGIGAKPTTAAISHEITHTVQQNASHQGTAAGETTVVIESLDRKGAQQTPGLPLDMELRNKAGQMLRVQKQGRTVLEGTLKSVQKVGHMGSDWQFTLTGARRS